MTMRRTTNALLRPSFPHRCTYTALIPGLRSKLFRLRNFPPIIQSDLIAAAVAYERVRTTHLYSGIATPGVVYYPNRK